MPRREMPIVCKECKAIIGTITLENGSIDGIENPLCNSCPSRSRTHVTYEDEYELPGDRQRFRGRD